jgi:hypothetical protein
MQSDDNRIRIVDIKNQHEMYISFQDIQNANPSIDLHNLKQIKFRAKSSDGQVVFNSINLVKLNKIPDYLSLNQPSSPAKTSTRRELFDGARKTIRRAFLSAAAIAGVAVGLAVLGGTPSASAATHPAVQALTLMATSIPAAFHLGLGGYAMLTWGILNGLYFVFKGVQAILNSYQGEQAELVALRARLSQVDLKVKTGTPPFALFFAVPVSIALDAMVRRRVAAQLKAMQMAIAESTAA